MVRGPKPRDRLLVRGSKPRHAMAGSLVVAFRTHALALIDARLDLLTRDPGLFQRGRHLLPRVLGPEHEPQLGNRGVQFGGALSELYFCLGDDGG